MALVEAYREPQQRRHLAHVCSAAVLLQLLLAALLVMVPLLVAYRSQGELVGCGERVFVCCSSLSSDAAGSGERTAWTSETTAGGAVGGPEGVPLARRGDGRDRWAGCSAEAAQSRPRSS